MRVVLGPEVFAKIPTAELLVMLWLGLRHRVVVLDELAPAYVTWLAGLDERLRQDWERVVGDALTEDAKEPSFHEIWVLAEGPSRWALPVPALTFADAVDLLQRPYRVLVENGFSDRAFLLSMCDGATRAFLEERIEREWLEVEHCGGIGHLEKRARELRKSAATRMRASALFDGDGMRPGHPSPTSQGVRDVCFPDLHHHQLERRAIENYLPRAALERWSRLADGRARRAREEQVEALFSLREEQHAHYNMKEGFAKDAPNAHRAGALWDRLPTETRRLLDAGLDQDIAKLYRDGAVRFEELERAAAVTRVQEFAREIVERVR